MKVTVRLFAILRQRAGRDTLELDLPDDARVSDALAEVLSGGKTDHTEIVTEDHVTKLERAAFMKLVKTEGTLARMETMLTTGKPLRN